MGRNIEDKDLLKLSFTIAILGIAALFFISEFLETNNSSTIAADDNSYISITGRAIAVKSYGKATRIRLAVEEKIDVVAFKNLSIEKGSILRAEGRVEKRKGKKEVIADSIEVLSGS